MARIPAALAGEKLHARMLLLPMTSCCSRSRKEKSRRLQVVRTVMEGACAPHCELSLPLVGETG
jgi:hypothetical protein